MRIIRHDEKKTMINSRGLFNLYDAMSAWMPKNKKNNEMRAIKIFLPHHDHEPIKPLFLIYTN
jgi:hypothetical protein